MMEVSNKNTPQLKRREAAEGELEQVKVMMEEQMLKAEIMVKDVEAKFRALPNPFEDEVMEKHHDQAILINRIRYHKVPRI